MVALANEEALPHDEEIMDDVDSDVEESDSEDDSGEEAQAKPSDKAIYNKEAILEKLEDIAWPKNVDWMHKLTIEHDQGEKVDVNDDLARELAFYTQVLDGTRQAFEKLQSMKVRFLRPTDYYAEMVKTDAHMHKIKGRLLSEKKRIEEAEERGRLESPGRKQRRFRLRRRRRGLSRRRSRLSQSRSGGSRGNKGDSPREMMMCQTLILKEKKDLNNQRKRGLVFLLVTGLVVLLSEVKKERTRGQGIPSLGMVVVKG